jgi:hypothetical protein
METLKLHSFLRVMPLTIGLASLYLAYSVVRLTSPETVDGTYAWSQLAYRVFMIGTGVRIGGLSFGRLKGKQILGWDLLGLVLQLVSIPIFVWSFLA